MRQKTRRLSIRTKILLPANLITFVVCIVLGLEAYTGIHEGMVAMGVEEAQMAATIAMDVADGDVIENLVPGSEDTEEYRDVLMTLREVQEKYNILYLYTVYAEGNNLYYGVDTDRSELQAKIGKPFEKSYDMLKGVLQGEPFVQDYIDYSEYGDVISVYEPIRNSEGKVVAILGCDYDATGVIGRLDESSRKVLRITVTCLLLALVILSFVVSSICKGGKDNDFLIAFVDGMLHFILQNRK